MMPGIIETIERRLFSRYRLRLPITFKVTKGIPPRDVTSRHDASMIDLSKRGCCLELNSLTVDGFHLIKCLEETGVFKVRLVLHGVENELTGIIRWINSDTESKWHTFRVGIEFLSPFTNKEIKSLIYRSHRQSESISE